MKYKGWEIEQCTCTACPFKFEAQDPDGDYPTKFSDSVDDLIEEIDDESQRR